MPVASALIFARVAAAVARKIEGRPQALHIARIACAVIVATSVGGGIYITATRIGYQTNDTELPLLDFVRENKRSGDVYLLPARFPNFAAAARGSGSNTFAPAPRAKPGAAHIPVDLQRFRLYTGAPIYIDFKSVPYGEDEVPEWRDRVHRCERWYDQRDWDSPEIWREVVEAGVTHVVTSADRDIKCRAFERIYADDHYRLYRLRPDRVPTEP